MTVVSVVNPLFDWLRTELNLVVRAAYESDFPESSCVIECTLADESPTAGEKTEAVSVSMRITTCHPVAVPAEGATTELTKLLVATPEDKRVGMKALISQAVAAERRKFQKLTKELGWKQKELRNKRNEADSQLANFRKSWLQERSELTDRVYQAQTETTQIRQDSDDYVKLRENEFLEKHGEREDERLVERLKAKVALAHGVDKQLLLEKFLGYVAIIYDLDVKDKAVSVKNFLTAKH